jgi:predicted O-linked N-acetylglucosamine transferase (SPINDLY family)
LRPGSAKALANLANAILYCGDAAGARPYFARARAAAPDDPATASSSLYALCYDDALPAADLLAAHRDWGRGHAPPPRPRRRAAGGRIKVGYVSGDFCRHSCAYVLAAVLPHHDRAAFEIVAYSNTPREDAMTDALKAHLDGFVRIVGEGDEALAARIAGAGVDVLVDLSGHTQGNRLGLFARRPAPVQLSWLGYPASTGLAQIDARATDAFADPEAPDADAPLVRLPDGFLAFMPPEVPAPAREAGPPTFASFNNAAKLGPRTVACWAAILRAVPEARLLLKALSFEDPGVVARFRRLFEGYGVDPARVVFVGWVGEPGGHLALYSRVDVALDPFPYNGTLTTLEALWAGVPVVTLAGDRHAARVGTAILTRIGRADLVAADESAYVRLAADAIRLPADRAALRAALAASSLMDGRRVARGLEAAYRDLLKGVS